MKINWGSSKRTVITTSRTGVELEWFTGLWSRGGAQVNDAIFENINEYLTQSPHRVQDRIFQIYQSLHNLYQVTDSTDLSIRRVVVPEVSELFAALDYPALIKFCLRPNRLALDVGVKDTLEEKDRPEITYFTQDYNDLIIMSEALKIFIPVMGGYADNIKPVINKTDLPSAVTSILRVPEFQTLPAMVRLHRYVNFQVSDKVETKRLGDGLSMTRAGGTLELNEHLIGVLILNKIVVFNARNPTASIVILMFHKLKQACDQLTISRPTDKGATDVPTREQTIADGYKITQKVPPAVSKAVEVYIDNWRSLCKAVEPKLKLGEVNASIRAIPPELKIQTYHKTILAAIFHNVINTRTIDLINAKAVRTLLGVGGSILSHRGLYAVRHVLITVPVELPVYNEHPPQFTPLTQAQGRMVDELYPLNTGMKSIGRQWIEQTVKIFERSSWGATDSELRPMSTELAQLLVNVNS